MNSILQSNNVQSNSSSYHLNSDSYLLGKCHLDILKFYYKLRVSGVEQSDYSLKELSVRLGRHSVYISGCLSDLESWGYMCSVHGGSTNKKRWISFKGFSMLDKQPLNKILNQNESTPYIDLSDLRSDQLKITEEAQDCGKLDPEQELIEFLEGENVSSLEKKRIKKAIKTSPIGPVRRESVIRRVLKAAKKYSIRNKLAYFLTALRKELQDLNTFIASFGKNKNTFKQYELNDIGEIGCFMF